MTRQNEAGRQNHRYNRYRYDHRNDGFPVRRALVARGIFKKARRLRGTWRHLRLRNAAEETAPMP